MKVTWKFLQRLHLDPTYGLLNARSAQMLFEVFKLLDWRGTGGLDDIQFASFLGSVTDLSKTQIYKVFDIFDLDRSGSVEFDEFYLLICILVAINDGLGKQFMYRHWRTCFEILDEDGSKAVSRTEFETLGFLFNFSRKAVRKIYEEFDVSGNQELDYNEFRLFIFAAMDMQADLEKQKRGGGGGSGGGASRSGARGMLRGALSSGFNSILSAGSAITSRIGGHAASSHAEE